jgi:uncharacterized protein (DUF2164 family)
MKDPTQLIEDHLDFIRELLKHFGSAMVSSDEFIYREAGKHFYGHGWEDAEKENTQSEKPSDTEWEVFVKQHEHLLSKMFINKLGARCRLDYLGCSKDNYFVFLFYNLDSYGWETVAHSVGLERAGYTLKE